MAGDRLKGKRRYLYRKKLLRRQHFLLNEIRVLHADRLNPNLLVRPQRAYDLKQRARELAGRMVRHGLTDQCQLLDHLVEEVMET